MQYNGDRVKKEESDQKCQIYDICVISTPIYFNHDNSYNKKQYLCFLLNKEILEIEVLSFRRWEGRERRDVNLWLECQ